jgi:P27 family predicted phage terminase small subunit
MVKKPTVRVIEGGDGTPPEPDWAMYFADDLDLLLARETWRTVVAEMREAQILSVGTGHLIYRLVQFRVIYERAARQVAEHGPILKRPRAKVGVWSPWWSVMRQSSEELRQIEAELGISPARRSRAGKVARAKPRGWVPADEFLSKPLGGRERP